MYGELRAEITHAVRLGDRAQSYSISQIVDDVVNFYIYNKKRDDLA